MRIFNNLSINKFLFFILFAGTASFLIYSLGSSYLNYCVIFIYLNLILLFLSKQFKFKFKFKFIKQYNKYFRIFRIIIMLFMLLKFKLTYDLMYYILCINIIILLGFALFRRRWFYAASLSNMRVIVNSESNKVTVIPPRNTRVMSNFDRVDYKYEFNLPNEQIQEITDHISPEVINNVITGPNADYIIRTYILTIIESSGDQSFFAEILNYFGG